MTAAVGLPTLRLIRVAVGPRVGRIAGARCEPSAATMKRLPRSAAVTTASNFLPNPVMA